MSTFRQALSACSTDALPWVRWGVEGAFFKLLHADAESGAFSLLIKMMPGLIAPRHRHIGAVEGMVLEGGFYYLEDPTTHFERGTYVYEPADSIHQPASPTGALLFGVFHGALEGLDAENHVTGRLDAAWHIAAWEGGLAIS